MIDKYKIAKAARQISEKVADAKVFAIMDNKIIIAEKEIKID